MNAVGVRMNARSIVAVVLLSGSMLSGCATDAQTAAAITAGGLLGLQLGATALTGSRLQVHIDMYSPSDAQLPEMRLDHGFALTRLLDRLGPDDGDPLRNATPGRILRIALELQSIMEPMKAVEGCASAQRLAKAAGELRSMNPQFEDVAKTLRSQADAAASAVAAWDKFSEDLRANANRIDEAKVLDTLVADLLTLRVYLSRAARLGDVTIDYVDFLKTQLRAALLEGAGQARLDVRNPEILAKINGPLSRVVDQPTAPGPVRVAVVLEALRQSLAAVPGDRTPVDDTLRAFGFCLDSVQLLQLDSADAIARSLSLHLAFPARVAPARTPASPASAGTAATSPACMGALAVIVVATCSASGYETITLDLNRATADINFGPISNEVQQVLQAASRGLRVITDPNNEGQWRLDAAYGKSSAGAGNHNSIIYLENMGLPIVKSSTFDPTKFVVALGSLYRQVFSAAVAAYGVPLASTAGAPGAADFQSSNVIATRARIRNADKAAAAAREKMLDALKATITQQQKIKDDPSWANHKADLIQAAQKALRDAASQLETVAGSN